MTILAVIVFFSSFSFLIQYFEKTSDNSDWLWKCFMICIKWIIRFTFSENILFKYIHVYLSIYVLSIYAIIYLSSYLSAHFLISHSLISLRIYQRTGIYLSMCYSYSICSSWTIKYTSPSRFRLGDSDIVTSPHQVTQVSKEILLALYHFFYIN